MWFMPPTTKLFKPFFRFWLDAVQAYGSCSTFQEALRVPGPGCWSCPLRNQYSGYQPAVPAVHSGGHLPGPDCPRSQKGEMSWVWQTVLRCQTGLRMSPGCWTMQGHFRTQCCCCYCRCCWEPRSPQRSQSPAGPLSWRRSWTIVRKMTGWMRVGDWAVWGGNCPMAVMRGMELKGETHPTLDLYY